jgi:hypothetical protein
MFISEITPPQGRRSQIKHIQINNSFELHACGYLTFQIVVTQADDFLDGGMKFLSTVKHRYASGTHSVWLRSISLGRRSESVWRFSWFTTRKHSDSPYQFAGGYMSYQLRLSNDGFNLLK